MRDEWASGAVYAREKQAGEGSQAFREARSTRRALLREVSARTDSEREPSASSDPRGSCPSALPAGRRRLRSATARLFALVQARPARPSHRRMLSIELSAWTRAPSTRYTQTPASYLALSNVGRRPAFVLTRLSSPLPPVSLSQRTLRFSASAFFPVAYSERLGWQVFISALHHRALILVLVLSSVLAAVACFSS